MCAWVYLWIFQIDTQHYLEKMKNQWPLNPESKHPPPIGYYSDSYIIQWYQSRSVQANYFSSVHTAGGGARSRTNTALLLRISVQWDVRFDAMTCSNFPTNYLETCLLSLLLLAILCPYNTSSLVIGNCLYFLIEFICINLSERNLFTERWLLKFDGRDRAEQSRHRHAGRQQHQRPPWQWWNKPYCWTFWSWNRVLIARTRRRMRKRRHRGDHPNISNSKLVPMAGWQGGGLLLVLWWLLLLFFLYLLFARPVQPTTSRRTSENEDHVELQIHTLWTWGFIHIFMQIFGDRRLVRRSRTLTNSLVVILLFEQWNVVMPCPRPSPAKERNVHLHWLEKGRVGGLTRWRAFCIIRV